MTVTHQSLDDAVPGRVSRAPADLEAHGRDETDRIAAMPSAVVFARDVDDVRATLSWASAAGVGVVPYGAGTGLEGHTVPSGDEIALDVGALDRVLSVEAADFQAVVQPGVTRTALDRAVRNEGLFFPVDPGADASLGGMAATNASGTTTVRYGGMRPNVRALEVVLADGSLVRLGRGVRKTSSGYDLKDLMIGSAGTLGVITELTVALHPVPEHLHAARVSFSSVIDAVAAAYAVMAAALPVERLELVDAASTAAINSYAGERLLPEGPALFVELSSSSAAAVAAEVEAVAEVAADHGALEVAAAQDAGARRALWAVRHSLLHAIRARYPGRHYHITDTAVPLSKVADMVAAAQEIAAELALEIVVAGHVADGNVHTVVPVVASDPGDVERAGRYSDRLVEYALAAGGTATGEHGIGVTKRRYLRAEHGAAVDLMAAIKQALDPRGILNPGKVL